jgi:hypothetical protein
LDALVDETHNFVIDLTKSLMDEIGIAGSYCIHLSFGGRVLVLKAAEPDLPQSACNSTLSGTFCWTLNFLLQTCRNEVRRVGMSTGLKVFNLDTMFYACSLQATTGADVVLSHR